MTRTNSLHKENNAQQGGAERNPGQSSVVKLTARNRAEVGKQLLDQMNRDLQMACIEDVADGTVTKPKFRDICGGTGGEKDTPYAPPTKESVRNLRSHITEAEKVDEAYFKERTAYEAHVTSVKREQKEFRDKCAQVAEIVREYISDDLLDAEPFASCTTGVKLYAEFVKYTKSVSELERQALRNRFEMLSMNAVDGSKLSYDEYKAMHFKLAAALAHYGLTQDDVVKQRLFIRGLSEDYVQIKVFMTNLMVKTYTEVIAKADEDTYAIQCAKQLGTLTPVQALKAATAGKDNQSGKVNAVNGEKEKKAKLCYICGSAEHLAKHHQKKEEPTPASAPQAVEKLQPSTSTGGNRFLTGRTNRIVAEDGSVSSVSYVESAEVNAQCAHCYAMGATNGFPHNCGLLSVQGRMYILLDGGSNRNTVTASLSYLIENVRPGQGYLRVASNATQKVLQIGDINEYVKEVRVTTGVRPVIAENSLIAQGMQVVKTAQSCVLYAPDGQLVTECISNDGLWWIPADVILSPTLKKACAAQPVGCGRSDIEEPIATEVINATNVQQVVEVASEVLGVSRGCISSYVTEALSAKGGSWAVSHCGPDRAGQLSFTEEEYYTLAKHVGDMVTNPLAETLFEGHRVDLLGWSNAT